MPQQHHVPTIMSTSEGAARTAHVTASTAQGNGEGVQVTLSHADPMQRVTLGLTVAGGMYGGAGEGLSVRAAAGPFGGGAVPPPVFGSGAGGAPAFGSRTGVASTSGLAGASRSRAPSMAQGTAAQPLVFRAQAALPVFGLQVRIAGFSTEQFLRVICLYLLKLEEPPSVIEEVL